jgi:uncharacterized membrane protein
MRKFIQKHSHKIFTTSILLKAAVGVLEIVVGALFYFMSYEAINKIGEVLINEEIAENPNSIFFHFLDTSFHSIFIYSKLFWAFLLLAHGITKVFLVGGLLRGKNWAYTVSAIIFSYFILDQAHRLFVHPSFLLGIITVFDVFVVFAILYEYRQKKRRQDETK